MCSPKFLDLKKVEFIKSSCIWPYIMKHDYENVAQIGNALYFMAILSKSPTLVSLKQY